MNRKNIIFYFIFSCAAALLSACGVQIPQQFDESNELPAIYPDYTNVTVPRLTGTPTPLWPV